MAYHALIALDLSSATESEKALFYQVLETEKWARVRNQHHSWKVSFLAGVTRKGAISTLEGDLQKAISASAVKRVDYVIQMDTEDLLISNLQMEMP
jgi:hypothetical protein